MIDLKKNQCCVSCFQQQNNLLNDRYVTTVTVLFMQLSCNTQFQNYIFLFQIMKRHFLQNQVVLLNSTLKFPYKVIGTGNEITKRQMGEHTIT